MSQRDLLDNDPAEEAQNIRPPVMLRVLCILTWVGSATMLGSLGIALARYDWDYFEIDIQIISFGINILSNIITIIGAWLMWRMYRKGFWIYMAGELAPLIPLAFFLMYNMHALLSPVTGGSIIGGVIVRVTFVILYARYYKRFR
jgi:hypothetical protein